MAGTWESQNKVLPGAYINIRTNEPLSITPGDRGTVAILQEMTAGEDKAMYGITATENDWPAGVVPEDTFLATEALKKAKRVVVYKLPAAHDAEDVSEALTQLKTVAFDTLCYPYDGDTETANKTAIAAWIKAMRTDEGIRCQAVLANHEADDEGIINVVQGIVLSGNTAVTAAQATAWVAGATAGAGITTSNTGMVCAGAIDVSPRMTKLEMEAAIKAGKFILRVDSEQNVSVVYDINSLTTVSVDKGKMFTKNRVIRTLDNIANDVTKIFEGNYVGRVNNNIEGRSLLKGALVDYFKTLQRMGAIQDFETDDVSIQAGTDTDAVAITVAIRPVDSVEKIYITVNCA